MVKRQPKGSKNGGQFAPDHSGSTKIPQPLPALSHVVFQGKPATAVSPNSLEQLHARLAEGGRKLTAREYQQTGRYRAEKLQEDVTPEGFAKLEAAISDLEKFIAESPFRAYAEDAQAEQLPVLLQRKSDALEARNQLQLSR